MTTLKDFESVRKNDDFVNIFIAVMHMNTSRLYELFDNDIDYADVGKNKFIDMLNETFRKHKICGDSEFYLDLDYCLGCNCNLHVCKFIGNNSNLHFTVFFAMSNGEITDIYLCKWYGDHGFSNPF